MLKTMVLCLLSFLFGVLTQKQWMWWAAPRTFDIFVPFACLHRSWACDQRKQVMPFAALWRCVRMSKETYRRWPICIWHGNFVFLSLPVFPWPRCLFVCLSFWRLSSTLEKFGLQPSSLLRGRAAQAVEAVTMCRLVVSWSLQVPSATLSATRPDFKPTWPGNRQMHAHMLAWAFFIYQECLYVFNCRMCRSAFVELLCFFWDASWLKHYILDSTPEGHAETLEWERDTFCLTFFWFMFSLGSFDSFDFDEGLRKPDD